MKKILLLLFVATSGIAFAQKVTKSTRQKTFAGMGGIFMNHVIEIKNKNADTIIIDSVTTIADTSEIRFASMKMKNGNYQITFGYAVSPPAKCKTCPDTTPKPKNMTKGVNVYYRKSEETPLKTIRYFKVKKFKLLPDLRTP